MYNFDNTITSNWQFVCNLVRKYLHDDGSDIAAIVFHRLSKQANPPQNEFALRKWLSVATIRLCYDQMKWLKRDSAKKSAYKNDIFNNQEPTTDQDAAEIERQQIRNELCAAIMKEINNLPPKRAVCFVYFICII